MMELSNMEHNMDMFSVFKEINWNGEWSMGDYKKNQKIFILF